MRDSPFRCLLYIVLLALALTAPAEGRHLGTGVVTSAVWPTVAPGCEVPTEVYAHTYYVDPAGSDGNDGLAPGPSHAWATPGHARDVVHTHSGGDLVLLYSGSYGFLNFYGFQEATFSKFQAVPGQTPSFTYINLQASSHWIMKGLTLRNATVTSGPVSGSFINISGDQASSGETTTNDIADGNDIASVDDSTADGWSQAQWLALAVNTAITVDGNTYDSLYASCNTVKNNSVKNVLYGFSVSADHTLFDNNRLDRFGHDGVDFAGNYLLMTRNVVKNGIYLNDGNHNDGFQGQEGHCPTSGLPYCTYSHVTMNGNVFIDRDKPAASLPFFTNGSDGTQGMSAFDEVWPFFTFINNIGIGSGAPMFAFYSAQNALIANNTCLTTLNGGTGGILVARVSHQPLDTPDGGTIASPIYPAGASHDVIVRNNSCSNLVDDYAEPTYTYDHNLISIKILWNVGGSGSSNTTPGTYLDSHGNPNTVTASTPTQIYRVVDFVNGSYDVNLAVSSPAIAAGVLPAPDKIDLTHRTGTPDVGAY